MKYVIYCDESRHDGHSNNVYMAIGSLWMPRERRDDISRRFRDCCRQNGLCSELKWRKISHLKLNAYKAIVDFFFNEPELCFRTIVVDQTKLDFSRFHGSDRELGFYKFYYELLWHWLEDGNEYLILLDFIQNKNAHRFKELRRILENKLKGRAWITDLTVVDSHRTPLGQLVDVLTGAVSAAWCDNLPAESAKREIIDYIGQKRRKSILRASLSSEKEKFNLFNIRLS